MNKITINKEWYDKLVAILDKLNEQIELDDKCVETHGWLSHLNGYVHSLDQYFKNTEETPIVKEAFDVMMGDPIKKLDDLTI